MIQEQRTNFLSGREAHDPFMLKALSWLDIFEDLFKMKTISNDLLEVVHVSS